MKIIVVSNPDVIENEANIVNSLFAEGLELFHLRKPSYSESELIALIQNINEEHHSKIALHQHHQIAKQFGIKRIHFTESERLKTKEEEFANHKTKEFILSTSIHQLKELDSLSTTFNYVLFGPVFESISKKGYKPNKLITVPKNKKINLIAIGGINSDKIAEVEKMDFDGAALLGAIWTDTKNAINTFKECNQSVNM